MTKEEYLEQVRALEFQIQLNKRMRCPLVAAKHERMLKSLKERYKEFEEK